MTIARIAHSPVEHHLEHLKPTWGTIGDYRIALEVSGSADPAVLALCDLSAMPKIGVKGPNAIAWLQSQGISAPGRTLDLIRPPAGGIIARTGGDEVFIEGNAKGEPVSQLAEALKSTPAGVYRLDRQDATFLVTGAKVHDVMLQTCGVNLAKEPDNRVIYSRVAGVSAAIVVETCAGQRAYRLWLDYTYASYLWEQLVEIMSELGGGVVGANAVGAGLTGKWIS